ncbi:MAG: ATP-dependent RNA helicase DbpA [Methanosaeta sp. PtaU1.Bin028]|nr:MAG: ATP-dependent RNA helicase DbpA [Methanosaeta sp. PtaU1.Bin028]
MPSYLEHRLLQKDCVEKRLFQIDLASTALRQSTLVVLPTGLGKTVVALIVLLARLDRGRVLFMAPTKPLVEQHASFLQRVLNDPSMVVSMTGEDPPDRRQEQWKTARIIAATPQTVENDLLSRRARLDDFSLLIFDEVHRATGGYSYVYIASRYRKEASDPLVLGITASPGSQGERIGEICQALGIERIETRTEDDPDVAPFVHHRDIEWVKVKVPDQILRLRGSLEDVLEDRIEELNSLGAPEALGSIGQPRIDIRASKKALLDLQKQMSVSVSRKPNQTLYRGLSILAEVMKIKHAVELAETQGMDSLRRYMGRLEGESRSRGGSKASRRLMEDPRIQEAMTLLAGLDVEHPKIAAAQSILERQLEEKPDSRIMVFTNYRDTATALLSSLKKEKSGSIRAVRFVGQASREDDSGLSQKKQASILEKFRTGEYNVLIATSVGEEGIDIPATDMVLFYEPVPSEIRSIQRKGRTGRARAGRVVVLMAKGTRDEAYYWISDRKERTMRRQIRDLSEPFHNAAGMDEETNTEQDYGPGGRALDSNDDMLAQPALLRQSLITDLRQPSTSAPLSHPTLVIVDPRERELGKRLEELGLEVALRALEVGDYVVSDRVGIERKSAPDFISSLVDPERGLFRQISDLSRSYEKPVMILEGEDLYSRQVHPNAVRGALASIAVDFGVPIIPARDADETAAIIALLARREQSEGGREVKAHGKKTSRNLREQQEYLVSAVPGVGAAAAKNLLLHFGSVQSVFSATYEELQKVEKVGPKTAERIRELVGAAYKG